MKYLASSPWLQIGESMARRVVVYQNGENNGREQFVVHSQTFQDGGVSYSDGAYFDSHKPIRKAMRNWLNRVTAAMNAGYDPAPTVLAEAAELAAIADRLTLVEV